MKTIADKEAVNECKVVHLASVHSPGDVRIYHKECKTLAESGYDVTLIAPGNPVKSDAVCIRTIPVPRNRLDRMLCTTWKVYRLAEGERAELYHFHDPELIPVGLLLKLGRVRVVYDVHEDLPRQVYGKYWIPRWLACVASFLAMLVERLAGWVFDGIVAATPTIASRFPPSKTITVQNFPRLDQFLGADSICYSERPPWITYIGPITEPRGGCEMIQAVHSLQGNVDAKLVLAGRFPPTEVAERIRESIPDWDWVEFLGWRSREEIVQLLSRSRVGLVVLHPLINYLDSYPTKLFEYMASGVPVVASDFPLWRRIVEQAGCGILVDPLDPKAIALAIRWLLEHPVEAEAMGKRGLEAVSRYYSWDREADKLVEFYEDLCGWKMSLKATA